MVRLLRACVDPAPSVADPIDGRRIRIIRGLCAGICMVGGPLSLGAYLIAPDEFLGDPAMTLAFFCTFILLFGGLGTRWWRSSLTAFAVVGAGVCWTMLSTAGSTDELSIGLVLTLLPFAFVAVLPGRLPMILVSIMSVLGATVVMFAVPELDVARFWQEIFMVFVVGGVLLGIQELARADHRDLVGHAREIRAAWTETEEARAAQGRFLAKIHHELRTPLNGVIGSSQVLQEISEDPLVLELSGAIQSSGDRLAFLIEDVLAYVAGEDEQLEINRVPVDAANLVRDTAARSVAQAERGGVSLRVEVADTPVLQLDPIRVSHVVGHLIRNAVRHSAGGSVRVEVWWRCGELAVGVHDSGSGLNEARLKEVFQAVAFRNEGEPDVASDGFGLGLATSRVLAKAMGGTLTASSEEGRGSSFWLRIPAAPAEAREAA